MQEMYLCEWRVALACDKVRYYLTQWNAMCLLFPFSGNVMVVMDSFALPVEGTETRVNAHEQAYEYMTAYMDSAHQVCHSYILNNDDIFIFTAH